VRATDPSGRAGKVQRDGSITYSDGTRVSHDPASGESQIVHADGTTTRTNANDPRRDGDSYVYGDGVRVRAVDPSGKLGQPQANGSIRYSDGTTVSHDVRSGDTKIVHADGSVEVTTANTPHREGSHYVWSDGQRAVATDRNGAAGKIAADGTIVYGDGSRVSHDVRTGDSKIVHADGSVETVPGNLPQRSGGNYSWSDGASAPANDPSGNPGKMGGDGWIVYSDGSMVSHDPVSGDSKVVHADGSMIMGNTHTGESKSFEPAQERGLSPPGADKGSGSGAPRSNSNTSADSSNTGRSGNSNSSNSNSSNSNSSNSNSSNSNRSNSNSSNSNSSNSNRSNSNSSNSNRSNSNSSNDSKKSESSPKSNSNEGKADKAEKPAKETTGKGRQAASDSPTGNGAGSGPQQRPGGRLDLTGQPVPGDSGGSGASASPTNIRRGTGPGGRPFEQSSPGGSRLAFDKKGLVINPNPVGLSGRGAVAPIDPNIGRR
jgi:hypothetical protein